jgi:hypothetical protein
VDGYLKNFKEKKMTEIDFLWETVKEMWPGDKKFGFRSNQTE